MKFAVIIIRSLMGLGFIIFGLNILYPFLPQPPMQEGSLSAQFMTVMGPTHWMSLVGVFQFLGGLLVIFGRTAPMGLVLLGPVLVNVLAFHVFLQNGEGLVPGLVFTFFEIFLIYAYRDYFKGILTTNAKPS